MLRWLEKHFGRWAVPRVTTHLVIVQALCFGYAFLLNAWDIFDHMRLIPNEIAAGDYWRMVSWVVIPPYPYLAPLSILFNFFALYLFWIYGTALEEEWGAFRVNLYLLVGFGLTFLGSWLAPASVTLNALPMLSVLFAFAVYHPDFEIRLFLLIPVKIKWIAMFSAALLFLNVLANPWPGGAIALLGVSNFLIFFGRDFYDRLRFRVRRKRFQAQQLSLDEVIKYECAVCRKTDRSHPEMDFRFCSRCEGAYAYCAEHLPTHTHQARQDKQVSG